MHLKSYYVLLLHVLLYCTGCFLLSRGQNLYQIHVPVCSGRRYKQPTRTRVSVTSALLLARPVVLVVLKYGRRSAGLVVVVFVVVTNYFILFVNTCSYSWTTQNPQLQMIEKRWLSNFLVIKAWKALSETLILWNRFQCRSNLTLNSRALLPL